MTASHEETFLGNVFTPLKVEEDEEVQGDMF